MPRLGSVALGASLLVLGAGLFLWASPAALLSANGLIAPLMLENESAENALTVRQSADVGRSRSRSGAVLIDNTGNAYTGLTVYSNAGGAAKQPLMRLEIDNPEWNKEVLYIHSDSPTSRGLIRLDSPAPEIEFVETDQEGAAGKFEIRVQHDAFQINSRRSDDTTFENKIEMTHDGDWVLRDGTLRVLSGKPAQFSGGLNVTGGCIAVDGKCLSGGSAGSAASLKAVSGKPASFECNSYAERGAMKLDVSANRIWVCNGPERGWDYIGLVD